MSQSDVKADENAYILCISILFGRFSEEVVQELLGHNQISMTMDIYSHVLPTMQKEAVSKLNDALQG